MSHFEIREHLLHHQAVRIIELLDAPMESKTYHELYDAQQFTIAYWYPPTDLLAMEEIDARLRAFHVARPIRQFVAYLAGVRARPIAVASPELVLRLRAGSYLAWIALGLFVVVEIALAAVVEGRLVTLLVRGESISELDSAKEFD